VLEQTTLPTAERDAPMKNNDFARIVFK